MARYSADAMTNTAVPLARRIGVLGALFLTLSAETPASSVFVIIPGVISAAGTGAILSMLLAGVVALSVALTYAELGSTFPSAGGEYAIVSSVLGPVAGFATFGINMFNSLLACAVLSLGVADYLAVLIPGISPVATALVSLALATGLGILNIRSSAAVTGAFLVLELVALAVVSVLGYTHPARALSSFLLSPANIDAQGAFQSVSLGSIATGAVVALFAYDGYGNAVYLAEEVHDVRRRLIQAVLCALAVTGVAELASLIAVLIGAPDLATLLRAGNSMVSEFTSTVGGELVGKLVSATVAVAILNAAIALVLMTGRQIYATARDGAWPNAIGGQLAKVHARVGSPWVATLTAGALSASLCLIPMKVLLLLSGSGVTIIYLLLTLACLLHGRRRRAAAPGWRLPLWPVPPVLALVLMITFAISSIRESGVSFACGIAAAMLAASYYAFVLRRRGGWRLRGPSVEEP